MAFQRNSPFWNRVCPARQSPPPVVGNPRYFVVGHRHVRWRRALHRPATSAARRL